MDAAASDGVKTIKVGVIAHHHPHNMTSLIISALRAMENVEVVEMSEKDIVFAEEGIAVELKERLKDFPESTLYGNELISPYAGMGRRGKGEKKRDRAMQRRFYGRRNTF